MIHSGNEDGQGLLVVGGSRKGSGGARRGSTGPAPFPTNLRRRRRNEIFCAVLPLLLILAGRKMAAGLVEPLLPCRGGSSYLLPGPRRHYRRRAATRRTARSREHEGRPHRVMLEGRRPTPGAAANFSVPEPPSCDRGIPTTRRVQVLSSETEPRSLRPHRPMPPPPPPPRPSGASDAPPRRGLACGSRRRLLPMLLLLPARSAARGDDIKGAVDRAMDVKPNVRPTGLSYDKMSDDQWKEQLSDVQYYVLRQKGTEARYSSVLVDETRPGFYKCAGCGTPLFDASSKFESGTGWPSFASAAPKVRVASSARWLPSAAASALGVGSEIVCPTCRGHVGEVFYDGRTYPGTPAEATGLRYCVDGAALVFYPAASDAPPVRGDRPSGDYAAQLEG